MPCWLQPRPAITTVMATVARPAGGGSFIAALLAPLAIRLTLEGRAAGAGSTCKPNF